MRAHRPKASILTICALACSAALPALSLAMGGGGGGGNSTPGASAPAYNPAEEYRKGVAALNDRNFKDALRAFEHVLEAAPRDANTHFLSGVAWAGLEEYKKARKAFEKAVKYDDTLVLAHKELGLAYLKLGEKGKAGGELANLRSRSEKCADACKEAADLKSAISALETALGGSPQTRRLETSAPLLFASAGAGDLAYLEAVSLINEHRYEAAIESLLRAEKAFGPHPDVLTYLGFANRKLRRYELAETYYLKALAVAPGHRGATEYYGELLVERGQLAQARERLAALEASCAFGCIEAEELRRWIAAGRAPDAPDSRASPAT